MKAKNIFVFFIIIILAANISFSFQTNSSNYKQNAIVSDGGKIVTSGSYKSYAATGIIAGVISSSAYKNWLGFFYTWRLADGQPCTTSSQCEGNYCCDNLCASSTCPEEAVAPGVGGPPAGAGGGGMLNITQLLMGRKNFVLRPGIVKTKIALGESFEEVLTIENTGITALTIPLEVEGIQEYLSLSEDVFELEGGEAAEVRLNFIGKRVGSFVGQIAARAEEIERSVPLIFEVVSKLVLFDVKLDIPAKYSEVEPGDELKTQITLLNVGGPEKVDVLATYFIKDLRGNIIYEETETFAVEKQVSYPKLFKIHETTEPGSYVAVVEIVYADSFAVSSQLFRVVKEKTLIEKEMLMKNATMMLLLVFIVIGVLSLLIYNLISIKKRSKRKAKRKK